MESPVREKLFEPDEKAILDAALDSVVGEAFKASNASAPIQFNRGVLLSIAGTIVESVKAAVVKATKRADAQQKTVDELTAKCARQAETVQSLEHRASRHADHLRRLEDRVKAIETEGNR